MEKVLLLILALLLAAGAALVHWGPVRKYVIACERVSHVTCTLERSRVAGTQRWQLQLGPDASAVVRVVPRRRGSDDVYLYLRSAEGEVFAAQFESLDPVRDAEDAAAELNRVFRSPVPARTRIEVSPPAYFLWLSWGLLGFTALLVLATYRELRSREQRPDNEARPTPLRGAA